MARGSKRRKGPVVRALLLLACAACSPVVTRDAVLDPARVVALGDRAEVTSLDGARTSGTLTRHGDAFAIEGEVGRALAPTARVGVTIEYRDGDLVPGEGRVFGTRKRAAYVNTGVGTLAAGIVLGVIGGVGVATVTCDRTTYICGTLGYGFLSALGGILTLVGGGLALAGAFVPAGVAF